MPIFLATEAVRQKSQTLRFRSGAEILELFGLAKGGKEYRRLVRAFERIFGATIFFGTDVNTPAARVIHRSRFSCLSEAHIWYDRDPRQTSRFEQGHNVIVLSDEFYREITNHPIPTDMEAVKMLAASPALLDLCMWLTYRCFTAKGRESIPLFGPYGLAHQLGCVEYSRPRRFRAQLELWLRSIQLLWPQCPAHLSPEGSSLIVNRALSVGRSQGES